MLNTAVNAWRNHTHEVGRSMERLATGKRINRASDDPAGSIAVDHFSADLESLNKQLQTTRLDLKYSAARDGGNAAIGDLLLELQGHVVQAANTGGTSRAERDALQDQVDSVIDAIDFVSNTYAYNGQRVFAGVLSSTLGATTRTTQQQDPNDPTKTIESGERVSLLSLKRGGSLNLIDGNLEDAQKVLGSSIEQNSTERAAIGARAKDLESQERLLQLQIEAVSSAKSQIQDTDYASEISNLVKNQVKQQAAAFMMQAAMNQVKQLTDLIAPSAKR